MVENCWPIPDGDGARVRGVAVEGPVASRRIARCKALRYEVRCWRDGTIADADAAVASPQVLSVIAWLLARAEQRLPEPAHAGSHGRI